MTITAFGFLMDLAALSSWSSVIDNNGFSQLIKKYIPAKNKYSAVATIATNEPIKIYLRNWLKVVLLIFGSERSWPKVKRVNIARKCKSKIFCMNVASYVVTNYYAKRKLFSL